MSSARGSNVYSGSGRQPKGRQRIAPGTEIAAARGAGETGLLNVVILFERTRKLAHSEFWLVR